MKSILHLFSSPGAFVIIVGGVIVVIWLVRRISPSITEDGTTSIVYNRIVFFVACCLWAISAFIAYALAQFSINQTFVNIVLLSSIAFLVLSFILLYKQKQVAGLIIAGAPFPLFIFIFLFLVPTVTNYIVPLLQTESPEFSAACKNAGAEFFGRSAQPVHSIAYDWIGKAERDYSRYELGRFGRLGGMGGDGFDKRFPHLDEVKIINEQRQYKNDASALPSDILVTYRMSPEDELTKAPIHQGPVTHELTVTDQRNGMILATMRYVVDQKDRRICGPIHNNVLSEKAFLAEALGLD